MLTRPDTVFFLASCSFVVGAITGGVGISPLVATLILALAVLIALSWKVRPVIVLAMAVLFLIGNIYYAVDDYAYRSAKLVAEDITSFTGRVIDEPRRSLEAQTLKVAVSGVRVYVRTDLYPAFSYGDVVRVSGSVVPPPTDSYGNYMMKEHVHGSMFYPEIKIIGSEENTLFGALFNFRNSMQDILGCLFNQQHSAFLSGILLGDKDGFSPEFLKKLSISGTMHLMALSGLNMTIIVFIALAVFGVIFREKKRAKFGMTFVVVALFVAMTGFQMSAIRAALMASLVGLADVAHKNYRPYTALAFAALVITVWNPKAPSFDLGFQLSFLATMAIIYLAPVVKRLPFLRSDGALGWRDALAITIAAQLGVVPLTIINFGNFSFTSLVANVAILAVIPLLTVLGFLVVLLGAIAPPLALVLSQPITFLIGYVIAIVEMFAVVQVPFNPNIGVLFSLLYYAVIIGIWYRWSPALQKNEKRS